MVKNVHWISKVLLQICYQVVLSTGVWVICKVSLELSYWLKIKKCWTPNFKFLTTGNKLLIWQFLSLLSVKVYKNQSLKDKTFYIEFLFCVHTVLYMLSLLYSSFKYSTIFSGEYYRFKLCPSCLPAISQKVPNIFWCNFIYSWDVKMIVNPFSHHTLKVNLLLIKLYPNLIS